MPIVQAIYCTHGWPELERNRKQECLKAAWMDDGTGWSNAILCALTDAKKTRRVALHDKTLEESHF
jgi:hypothetical protein